MIKRGFDLIWGRNSVKEALQAEYPLQKILLAKNLKVSETIRKIIHLAQKEGIPILKAPREKLDQLSRTNTHQGIIAFTLPRHYDSLEDILKLAQERQESPFILILDNIQDPQNLGALMRTSEAVGVHGLIIPKRRAVGLSPAVSKASAGADKYIKIARVSSITALIERLKHIDNLWIVGSDHQATLNYTRAHLEGPIAVIMGSEGKGLRVSIKKKCDQLISIPMRGKINSLNVGVAGALILYEIFRRRKEGYFY